MSTLNGCQYFVYNATDEPISGKIQESYDDNKNGDMPPTELPFTNLAPKTATEHVRFACGTNHNITFEYDSPSDQENSGNIKLSEDYSFVALVFTYNNTGKVVMEISKPAQFVSVNVSADVTAAAT